MDSISQTFSRAFSWMKKFEFQSKFHWSLYLRVQLTIFLRWFRWWLDAVQATSHYLNQWWLVYRCIYALLSLKELNETTMKSDCHELQTLSMLRLKQWKKLPSVYMSLNHHAQVPGSLVALSHESVQSKSPVLCWAPDQVVVQPP